MVQFKEDTITDDQSDALALARAFRAASDNDTRSLLNAMSSQPQSGEEESSSLMFYIVPASWFLQAYPILTARSADGVSDNWREDIGRISNAELMNTVEREVSSDDEDAGQNATNSAASVSDFQKKRFDFMHRRMGQSRQQSMMKAGLEHMKDYFFLGPSAWMLVKEKFDFDGYELARPCVPSPTGPSSLAIQLNVEESEGNVATLIDIPVSGKFAYEKGIAKSEASSTSAIVPEDDGNTEDEGKSEDESPVLLLPPSTTAQSGGVDETMEVDDDESGGELTSSVFAGRKRYASGLANLGNTCFMNSSIQCLAHTDPLRRYFLSGEYARDLNKDNPLGTGGELATQFATLIGDMWGVPAKRRSVMGTQESTNYNLSSPAIYPRSFKHCLGKHAEQFVGYDQHDSQELATYLLDALHEDTNRVTKKPYIEIPEQGEDEPDDVAADKAWKLHLQREDSRVLENFMGQVKSRLECCQESCNRVSTTFDPFMFLSVPIPGSTERTLKVTFVPLDPKKRRQPLSLTVSKAAAFNTLFSKVNEELIRRGLIDEPIPLEDLCAADVWTNEVFSWYQDNADIDRIRDSDKTFIFQLRTLSEVQEESKPEEDDGIDEEIFGPTKRTKKYKLDLETMIRLNSGDAWQTELEKYVVSHMHLLSLFNPKRGSNDERLNFHRKLDSFINICHKEITEEETTGTKRSRDGRESGDKTADVEEPSMDDEVQGLVDQSDVASSFKNVRSRHDVAVLDFCEGKLRTWILNLMKEKKSEHKDGVRIQVIMRRPTNGSNYGSFVEPLVFRIPASMTVYSFREMLAKQISRSLKIDSTDGADTGESSAEISGKGSFGSPESMVLRQVALSYERKGTYGSRAHSSMGNVLGMIAKKGDDFEDGSPPPSMAMRNNDDEMVLVADTVGPNGTIFVDWSEELCQRYFDEAEFENEDNPAETQDDKPSDGEGEKVISVLDCIDKYCQKEQLEETEMWYCNKCKDHVRAWKQFHIYRAPPILIVHLKRFHFSASTHRRNKITSFIDFPLEGMDLTKYVSHYEEGQEPIYDCYAVSNHYGNLGGGHYTAYTLGDDGTWCHYDDTRVTNNLSPKEVITEAAYVLYYRRRDVDVGQDPILENQTAAFVVDHNDPSRDTSEISSNHTPQAAGVDDDDDDNMAVDGDGSSRTSSSPISDLGSVDGGEDEQRRIVVSFVPDHDYHDEPDFPLQ